MKNFIMIAGLDYSPVAKTGKRGTNFNVYCEHRHKTLYNKEKGTEDLNFYFLDMFGGIIKLVKYAYDATSLTYTKSTSTHATYDPITKSNYYTKDNGDGTYSYRFNPRGKNLISKYVIYDLIAQIGKDSPGTLVEVSLYSHAFLYGPILVNSDQHSANYIDPFTGVLVDVESSSIGYDPNDYDMRVWDFTSYYNQADIDIFQKKINMIAAFTTDGVYRVWGCNQVSSLNYFFSQLRSHSSYKKIGLVNTDEFKFPPGRIKENIRVNLAAVVGRSRGIVDFKIESTDEVILTWLEIKKFISLWITNTYAYWASKFFDTDVMGALPTTDSNFTKTGFKINPATISNIPMFETYFGFEIGPPGETANYATFKSDYNYLDYL